MEQLRKPLQGVGNIIRFNRHFYLLAIVAVIMIFLGSHYIAQPYALLKEIVIGVIVITTSISLLVSYYIYDFSGLYQLNWLNQLSITNGTILNIHAGFDETSSLLRQKFPNAELTVFDFYDPVKHTEISIKRARKAYPVFENTIVVNTHKLPLPDSYADYIFVIFSAHEIRHLNERDIFFAELKRVLKNKGNIVITEHLRDLPNMLAYNIGFFHFMSGALWRNTFKKSGLVVCEEFNFTPFITTFILAKYEN